MSQLLRLCNSTQGKTHCLPRFYSIICKYSNELLVKIHVIRYMPCGFFVHIGFDSLQRSNLEDSCYSMFFKFKRQSFLIKIGSGKTKIHKMARWHLNWLVGPEE